MKRIIQRLTAFMFSLTLVFSVAGLSIGAEVVSVPAPENQGVDDVYRITVDGHDVAVYRAHDQEKDSGEYYFATFEFEGAVSITIEAPFSLENATVAPDRFGVKVASRNEKSAVLEADRPFMISFEPNGKVKPLLLFGFALEKNAPKEGDPNVVYFGPGEHSPGVIKLTDNQTLYLAAGAVVNGGVEATGNNITICGRGILSGANWKRFEGPTSFLIKATDCKSLTIRDVALREPWSWSCVLQNCEVATIDGLRVCASNMINDDALDLCNSRYVTVKNCFFRAQDDSVAIKGIRGDQKPCERIEIRDCTFWTDRANVFRIGYECQAEHMSDIAALNIDVLYYSVNYRDHNHYWANAIVWLQPNQEMTMESCLFEDVRIRSKGEPMIVLMAKPMSCSYGAFENPTPGRLRNCTLRNFTVYGAGEEALETFGGELYLGGQSEKSDVCNILIENFEYFGKKIDQDSPCVIVDQFVKDFKIRSDVDLSHVR